MGWLLPILWLVAGGSPAFGFAPETWVGDWAPTDETQIRRFCRRHGALTGTLKIGPEFPGTDLQALACITGIGASIEIVGAPNLTRLAGLGHLDRTEAPPLRELRITDNPALEGVAALGQIPGLQYQKVIIAKNPRLTRIHALDGLVSGGRVRIAGNDQLTQVEGFTAVKQRSSLRRLVIENNPALDRVEGFQRIAHLERLIVHNNPALTELRVIPAGITAGELTLTENPSLAVVHFAPQLAQLSTLTLRANPALQALPTWRDLTRLEAIDLEANDSLTAITGLTSGRPGRLPAERVRIVNNAALSQEEIRELLAGLSLPRGEDAVRIQGPAGDVAP